MAKIATNLTDLIGNTPLKELSRFQKHHKFKALLIAKLEYSNPGRSVKDLIGLALIKDAEKKGLIKSNSVIIEPTSGNIGIRLALVAAIKKCKLILSMPKTMSIERRSLIKALGAEIILTPGFEGMGGAIRKAEELQ